VAAAAQRDATPDRSVLIVDDDVDGADALKYLLESEGYAVQSVGNGRDALQYLREVPRTSVVILDLAMPVMTGWQFLAVRQCDEALARIPVIVVSASLPAAAESDFVMTKPVDLDLLLDRVGAACAAERTRPPRDH
jgi:CheY-like chemotaxis protein